MSFRSSFAVTGALLGAFLVSAIAVEPCLAVNDSLYFLFQRSTYLENTTIPCAWWANPAVLAETDRKIALSGTVFPLGGTYTLASARYCAPAFGSVAWGIGVLGAGINHSPGGSLTASNSGAQYRSSTSLSNPSVQIGAAARSGGGFSAGFLLDGGVELLPDGGGGQANFFMLGIGMGAMTPYFGDKISLAVSYLSQEHFWLQNFWDHDGKACLRFKSSDSLVMGSLEYTFSLVSGAIKNIYNSDATYYQVVKVLTSIRALGIMGALIGYSQDLGILSDNGPMIHLGAEIRRSAVYPYFAGYEIGIGTTQRHRDLLVHRLWVGYCFP
jgi:hypothetical protein